MEQAGPNGDNSMFALKTVDKSGVAAKIAKGKMAILTDKDREDGLLDMGESDEDSDPEEDRLDREMDSLYDVFQARKAESDAKFRAKKQRKEHNDDEWEGFSGHESSDDDEALEEDSSEDGEDDEDLPVPTPTSLLTDLNKTSDKPGALSRRATQFFDQDLFKDIGGIEDDEDEEEEEGEDADEINAGLDEMGDLMDVDEDEGSEEILVDPKKKTKSKKVDFSGDMSDDDSDDNGFEVVKRDAQWEDQDEPRKDGRLGNSSLFP